MVFLARNAAAAFDFLIIACVKAYKACFVPVCGLKTQATSARGAYLTLQKGNVFQVRHIFPFTDEVKDISQKQQQWYFFALEQ